MRRFFGKSLVLPLASGALVIAYFVIGEVSLGARTLVHSVSPIWPSTGLGLAAALTWGCAYTCPAILLASAAIAASLHLPPVAILAVSLANALEVYAAGKFLIETGLDGYSFFHPRDFAVYTLVTAASTAAASLVVAVVFDAAGVSRHSIGFVWMTRSFAHWTGMLTVTPVLLIWKHHQRLTGDRIHRVEGLALAVATTAVNLALFSPWTWAARSHMPLSFVLLPLALWPAVRMGLRETATVILATAGFALWGTVNDLGPFAGIGPAYSVTVLQGFLATEAILTMSLASTVWRSKDQRAALDILHGQLRLITDAVPALISYMDRNLVYRFVNEEYERWFGLPREKIIGRTTADLAGAEYAARVRPALERAVSGETVRFAEKLHGRDLDVILTPDLGPNGTVRGLVTHAVDVSNIKKAELALREADRKLRWLNGELERRVEKRTERLRQVNEELEAFCYAVAHDLRSPLRKMSGFSEAVLHDYGDKLPEKGADYLERINRASRRMGVLIEQMLELSLVTRRDVVDEPVDLTALAREIGEDLQRSDPSRRVQLVVAEGLKTHGDPALLESALRNLLDNAWKFTRKTPDARVEVGMRPLEPEPLFFVRDNGAGFEPAHRDRMFLAFERLHAAHDFPGDGIGLATVKRVIQRHGGRVWAEGEPGKGATFFFRLHEKPV